jgi:hypothetical protein
MPIIPHARPTRSAKIQLALFMPQCYRLFAVIATTHCTSVSAGRSRRGRFRLVCSLFAATLAALLLYALALAANDARAGTPQDDVVAATAVPADPTPQGIPPAQIPSAQKVANEQVAGAEAAAIQQQPTNIVISIRIDSPGDNGPISQTNVVVAGANGSNSSSTGQDGGSGQDASTDQQAAAGTTVTQDGAGNLVVTVRINSPGNNGPVSQTNAAIGSSNAENTSGTTQSQPTEAPAANATSTRTPARRPHRTHRKQAAPRRIEAVATAPVPATPVAPTVAEHGSVATAPRAAAHAHPVKHALGAHANRHGHGAARAGLVSAGTNAASALGKAIANAGDLLGTAAPPSPVGAPGQPADVSSSVIVTLLAVLGTAGLFAVWSLRPGWLRQKRLRSGALR